MTPLREPEPAVRFRRILAAVDLGPRSGRVLETARDLARSFDARLEVVHVVHDLGAYVGFYLTSQTLPDLMTDLRKEAQERLLWLCREHLGSDDPSTTRVLTGLPAPALLEHLRQEGFDLVVLGRHGEGKPEHALVGSTANRILSRAPCAVLTIP